MSIGQYSRWMVFGAITVVFGLLVWLSPTLRAESNPFLGTWKLNLAKSTYDPGPPPKSDDRTLEAWEGDGVKATYVQVDAAGHSSTLSYAAHYDGEDYRYTGSASRDTIALRRIDANTVESVLRKGGQAMLTIEP